MTTKWVAGQVKSLDARRISFIASHEKTDRDGEVVLIAGIDTTDFQRNPVLCLQHQARETPIGRVENLRKTRIDGAPALIGEAVFPERPASNEALADVRAGLLNSISIGFQVLERGAPILPGQHGVTYVKTALLEISLVTVPACATCVVTSKSACGCSNTNPLDGLLILDDEVLFDDELARLTRQAVRASIREVVRTEAALAVRRERDYQRGRIIDY